MSITHAAVKESTLTCEACPEQYEGQLVDGRYFYFRYRHGQASLAVGASPEEVNGVMLERLRLYIGPNEPDGMFIDQATRDNTFAKLLASFE